MNKIQILRVLSIAGAFLVGFWLPIRMIGFEPPIYLEISFDFLISAVCVFNMIIHFNTTKENPRVLKNWLKPDLVVDFAALLPVASMIYFIDGHTPQWAPLLNLVAARHIKHIRPFLDYYHSLKPITYRLVPLFVSLPLLVHLIACGWIALGSGTAGLDEDNTLTYVKAVYWTFTTLTTVGYGDIAAKTISQMLFTCVVQVIGVGVFGYILSNVAGLLARSDAAREHHMDNLDKIETFMKMHKTPEELRSKIRTFYHYMWLNKKGYKDDALLVGLPAKIQSELFMHINKPIIEKVSFLKGADREFLEDLMGELKPVVFIPEEKIFRVDEMGEALYFIQSGSVEIVGKDGATIATLGEGSVFGEMALISERPRSATAVAKSFCDIYTLHREAFYRVMKQHPHFREHIEKVMAARQSA